jgi:hypothetical protein
MKGSRLAAGMALGLTLLARPGFAQSDGQPAPFVTAADREARNEGVRRDLLAGYVGEHVRRENFGETYGYVVAGFGLLLGISGAIVLKDDQPLGATWVATSAVSTTTVATSLFFSRDTRVDLLQVNTWVVIGGLALGGGISEDPSSVHPLTNLSFAGAAFAYGGLKAVNLASRRTPLHVLRRHRERFEAGRVSNGELPKIERDFRGTDDPIPYQVLAVPPGLGAAVALLPAFDSKSSQSEKTWSLIGAGGLALSCVFSLLTVNLVPAYEEDLGIAGLEILAGPNEIDAVLRF